MPLIPLARSILAASALLGATLSASAQAFPSQPLRVIAPFSAGSGPDAAMRILAEQLSAQWKQPVLVDNRPGASGIIAVSAAKAAAPTGYDLLLADVGHMSINPSMFKSLPYNPKADFVPITTIFTTAFFVAVGGQSKIHNLKDLVAAASAAPEQVSYGSFAIGSIGHLGGAQLEAATHTRMVHVAFKEASQLYASIAVGDVTWGLASIGSAGALLKADKLRFIAVADKERSPILPQVPTIQEAGGPPGINGNTWVALFAPKGTPPAVVARMNAVSNEVLADPAVKRRLAEMGATTLGGTPQQLADHLAAETEKWARVVRDARIAAQ